MENYDRTNLVSWIEFIRQSNYYISVVRPFSRINLFPLVSEAEQKQLKAENRNWEKIARDLNTDRRCEKHGLTENRPRKKYLAGFRKRATPEEVVCSFIKKERRYHSRDDVIGITLKCYKSIEGAIDEAEEKGELKDARKMLEKEYRQKYYLEHRKDLLIKQREWSVTNKKKVRGSGGMKLKRRARITEVHQGHIAHLRGPKLERTLTEIFSPEGKIRYIRGF